MADQNKVSSFREQYQPAAEAAGKALGCSTGCSDEPVGLGDRLGKKASSQARTTSATSRTLVVQVWLQRTT